MKEIIFTKPKHLKTEIQLHKLRGKLRKTQIITYQIGERILTKFYYVLGIKEPQHQVSTSYPIIRRTVIHHI